jgi:hypothetical protein
MVVMNGDRPKGVTIDLRPRPAPGRVWIAAIVIAATTFLCVFDENPHCTQRVSFATAVFESEHHPEDKGWAGPPLVFAPGFGWLLRGVLGAVVLGALFTPAILVCAYRENSERQPAGALVQIGVAVCPIVVSLLPREVIGERFQELLRATSLVTGLLVPISMLAAIRIRRWRVRAQADLEEVITALNQRHRPRTDDSGSGLP